MSKLVRKFKNTSTPTMSPFIKILLKVTDLKSLFLVGRNAIKGKEAFEQFKNQVTMTKPGFIRNRLLQLFSSDDIIEQQRIVDNYNKIRNKECYCGHTDKCDCGNPGIDEFHNSLKTNSIIEEKLSTL